MASAALQPFRRSGRSSRRARGAARRPGRAAVSRSRASPTGQGKAPATGFDRCGFSVPRPRRRDRARCRARRVQSAVGREVDVDDRIVEPAHSHRRADRRVLGQVDDAVVVVGNASSRSDTACRGFDAADDAFSSVMPCRECRCRRGEHALHAGARVGRAAHDLHGRAVAGIDHAHAQAVGVGMLLGLDDMGDDREGRQRLRLVLDALDLEADAW
jgi:hypothetical protein